METPRNSDNYDISIHALRKESDKYQNAKINADLSISIHALRKESDSRCSTCSSGRQDFNPRSP